MGIFSMFGRFESKLKLFLRREPTKTEIACHAFRWACDYILYGCSFTDYFGLGFYHMKAAEKKTYHTIRAAQRFAYALDSNEAIWLHDSKVYEYQNLSKYFKRDQIVSTSCSYDEFCDFSKKHPVFFYKPDASCGGNDVQKITVTESNCREVFERVSKETAVLDEPVVQHRELSRLCPGSVNTIRVVTARIDGKVHFIGAALRMGDGKRVVDNYGQGGLVAAVDMSTGRLIADATNFSNASFVAHPHTNVTFKGFQIPHWNDVLRIVEEAGTDYTLNFVGWDVAVRENDCVLIEANPCPMVRVYQVAGNGGKRAVYDQLYKLWKKTDKKHR